MMNERPTKTCFIVSVLLAMALPGATVAQVVTDTAFRAPIQKAAYAEGTGPRVLIDEAHDDFHTADGRFAPFAALLRHDGFVVSKFTEQFTPISLRAADLLVIANARTGRNGSGTAISTVSAFTPAEIAAVRDWVEGGGRLLLIADHMPFPAAAADLAAAFGLELLNGFAASSDGTSSVITFRRSDGSLRAHAIADGRTPAERVDSVRAFTGSAFRVLTDTAGITAAPLMVLPDWVVSLEPKVPWEFDDDTPRRDVGGWLQGAALTVGNGRMVMLGEAAMLSAQLAGPQRQPVGMNAPDAAQNPQFVLNLIHWLTGIR